MRILFVSTVSSHIGQFHMPFIRRLKELGCTVDAAFKDNSNEKGGLDFEGIDNIYHIPFSRSPYSFDNIKAYKELKKLIAKNKYDAVHCHTPMGAVVARLAAKGFRKNGLKVIYTAHGFHFFKGASKFNWLFFYPVEKLLSKYTDCLITINKEDYAAAKHNSFKAKRIVYVPGVGVDLKSFSPKSDCERIQLRKEYGYNENDFLMIYPADFSKRKNQTMLLYAMQMIVEENKNVRLLLPGPIENSSECQALCRQLNISEYVDFLGYRRDIDKLAGMCDISVSSSRQEGLPINLIEAMALSNPIVATDVRGNNDLVENGVNGYLVALDDSRAMADAVLKLSSSPQIMEEFKAANLKMVGKFEISSVLDEMISIYKDLCVL